MTDYYNKYLKYKNKYLKLKGGLYSSLDNIKKGTMTVGSSIVGAPIGLVEGAIKPFGYKDSTQLENERLKQKHQRLLSSSSNVASLCSAELKTRNEQITELKKKYELEKKKSDAFKSHANMSEYLDFLDNCVFHSLYQGKNCPHAKVEDNKKISYEDFLKMKGKI